MIAPMEIRLMAMTKDESLRLFNKEIKLVEDELYDIRQREIEMRGQMLGAPIIFDKKLDNLYFRKLVLEDRLKLFCESRDRLLLTMMEECL